MSLIKITAVRSKDIVWTGGTFRKYEVKTDKTGDEILELRLGKDANAKAKVGDVVEGYIENSSYMGKNGRVEVKLLKKVSAEYVYRLLLKLAPGIESTTPALATPAKDEGFTTEASSAQAGAESVQEEIGW